MIFICNLKLKKNGKVLVYVILLNANYTVDQKWLHLYLKTDFQVDHFHAITSLYRHIQSFNGNSLTAKDWELIIP